MGNALFKNCSAHSFAYSFRGYTSYSEVGSLSCFGVECATFQISLRLALGFVLIFMFITMLYLFASFLPLLFLSGNMPRVSLASTYKRENKRFNFLW